LPLEPASAIPVDNTVHVQKELRNRLEGLGNTGLMTDQIKSADGIRALTETVARDLGIKLPDQANSASTVHDGKMDVDGMLARSAKSDTQPTVEAKQTDVHPVKP
jgi:hypothetical protein